MASSLIVTFASQVPKWLFLPFNKWLFLQFNGLAPGVRPRLKTRFSSSSWEGSIMVENFSEYHVLLNHLGRMSLWRSDIPLPDGWEAITSAPSCVEASRYVDEHWDHSKLSLHLSPAPPAGGTRGTIQAHDGQLSQANNGSFQTSILARFEDQASRVPDRVALQWDEGELTYRDVSERVSGLVRLLMKCGVGSGCGVAVAMPRGAAAVVGMLAVWAAGGVYVPVDPSLPANRMRLICAEVKPSCVLVGLSVGAGPGSEAGKLFEGVPRIVVNDVGIGLVASGGNHNGINDGGWASASRSSPAYVLYAADSTGSPRGVLVEHGAIGNYVAWLRNYLAIDESDRLFLQAPLSFDVSLGQCLAPLTSGGSVFLARSDGEREPAYVREILESRNVTLVHFVPSALRSFVASFPEVRLPHLRALLTSGERLSEDLERVCINDHGFTVHNLYGPTEASVDVTYHQCGGIGGAPPIGRPVANATVYVLSPDLNRIDEADVTGEIFLAGPGLARGYLSQPGATAQRFIADPHGPAGDIMYRTGDCGRWNEYGELEFLGRVDDQVQICGHRIEFGEVEAALRCTPDVHDAVVVAHDSSRRGKTFLVAFLAVGPSVDNDRSAIVSAARRSVASHLPSFMSPARYQLVERFPVTRSGKTDRQALARSFRDTHPAASTGGPGTTTSRTTRELVAETLCEPELDDTLTFLQLGGDSMDAIGLVTAARHAGVDLRITDLIGGRPVGEVLRIVAERPQLGRGDDPGTSIMVRGEESSWKWFRDPEEWKRIADEYTIVARRSEGTVVEDIWPLTPLQEGLLVQSLYDDTRPDIYTVQIRIDTETLQDPACVGRAVSHVVAAHPALRSAFVLDRADEPVQIVLREVEVEVEVVDLPADADETGVLANWLLTDRQRRFDLTIPPLHRFTLVRLGGLRACVVFTHHHALLDGWSVNIVLGDVLRACRQDASPIDAVSPQAFALWARNQVRPEALQAWHHALADSGGLVLASRPAPPAAPDMWSVEHLVVLTGRETDLVNAGAVAAGVTPATMVAGAWAVALGRAVGHTEATHGLVVSGRECPVPGVERTVGLLMNTIPVVARWHRRESWKGFLTRLQAQRAELAPYWYQPLREIRRAVGLGATFDTCLVFGTYPTIQQVAPDVAEMVSATSVDETSEFSLLLYVELQPHVRLRFTYWPHVLDRSRCEQIAEDVRSTLLDIAHHVHSSGPDGVVEEDDPVAASAGDAAVFRV